MSKWMFFLAVCLMCSMAYAQVEPEPKDSAVEVDPRDTGNDTNPVINQGEAEETGGNNTGNTEDAGELVDEDVQTELQVLPWQQLSLEERQPLAYDYLREADIFWYKIIWRVLDCREKMNKPLIAPTAPLINVLLDAAESGTVTLYDGLDDEFKTPVDLNSIPALASQTDSIWVYNPLTEMDELTIISNVFNPESVKKYRLKEIWFFNEETSTLETRILGIAPIMEKYGEFGNYQGDVVLFWAYFPELRQTLVQTQAYNPFPNGIMLTFDDLFALRLFSSYIIKQDNVDDLRIQDYTTGINALYESERIEETIFNFEHDLWSY